MASKREKKLYERVACLEGKVNVLIALNIVSIIVAALL